jgi:hypothetical protein
VALWIDVMPNRTRAHVPKSCVGRLPIRRAHTRALNPSVPRWQWQSIYQDDPDAKYKGVVSLVAYTTLCSYMLVPLDANVALGGRPSDIPNYGERGWYEGPAPCDALL